MIIIISLYDIYNYNYYIIIKIIIVVLQMIINIVLGIEINIAQDDKKIN